MSEKSYRQWPATPVHSVLRVLGLGARPSRRMLAGRQGRPKQPIAFAVLCIPLAPRYLRKSHCTIRSRGEIAGSRYQVSVLLVHRGFEASLNVADHPRLRRLRRIADEGARAFRASRDGEAVCDLY